MLTEPWRRIKLFFFLTLRGAKWSKIEWQILLNELAKASGHGCCMKVLEVQALEKASQIALAESALRTRERPVAQGLSVGGDEGT